MKILVADDDRTTLTLASGILENMGYEVVKCADGTTARDALSWTHPPKIALLDWMTPGATGIEVTRQLRESYSLIECYIILLTGKSLETDIISGLAAGANDYIVKPFRRGELEARINVAATTMKLRDEVKTLRGLLPICAWCKSIRNDESLWESIEQYLRKHSDLKFTHGLCKSCKIKVKEESRK